MFVYKIKEKTQKNVKKTLILNNLSVSTFLQKFQTKVTLDLIGSDKGETNWFLKHLQLTDFFISNSPDISLTLTSSLRKPFRI